MSRSTRTTGRSRSSAIASARRKPTTCWSTRRRTPAGSPTSSESASGRFCVISGGDHDTSEQRLLDLADADATPRLVAAAREGRALQRRRSRRRAVHPHQRRRRDRLPHRHGAARHAGPRALARADRAPAGRLYPLASSCIAGHLVRLERANALPSIVIRDLGDGAEHSIAFDEEAYSLDMQGGYEFDTTTLRFAYSSMTTPAEVYDYDMATRQRTLRKRQEIPSGHDPAHYVTTRLFAKAQDGAEVPVSLLHRRDVDAGRHGAAAALRLRLLRHGDAGVVLGQPAVAGRPRLRLCHRPYPRRRRQGLGLVPRRQAREEDQHLRRLHRRRPRAGRRAATPRPAASWPMAAAPAAC